MKFRAIVVDVPWGFSDKLKMSDVKRGSASVYKTMTVEQIKLMSVEELAEDDSVLCLWVPSSLLQTGLDVMNIWGFRQTQTWVWVKMKKDPFGEVLKELLKGIPPQDLLLSNILQFVKKTIEKFDIHDVLSFGMGRLGRNVHEICLVGVKGSPYKHLKNKSQRTVFFAPNEKHSKKPEILQDRLEIMFGEEESYLEIFGRRERKNWTVIGNECPSTMGQDVFDSIEKLKGKNV